MAWTGSGLTWRAQVPDGNWVRRIVSVCHTPEAKHVQAGGRHKLAADLAAIATKAYTSGHGRTRRTRLGRWCSAGAGGDDSGIFGGCGRQRLPRSTIEVEGSTTMVVRWSKVAVARVKLAGKPADDGYHRKFVPVFRQTDGSEAARFGQRQLSVMQGVGWRWLDEQRLRSAEKVLEKCLLFYFFLLWQRFVCSSPAAWQGLIQQRKNETMCWTTRCSRVGLWLVNNHSRSWNLACGREFLFLNGEDSGLGRQHPTWFAQTGGLDFAVARVVGRVSRGRV